MGHEQESHFKQQYEALRDYWKNPQGVEIEFDRLKFLYVTDQASHMMTAELASLIQNYQRENLGTERQITKMAMIMMGGLYPAVLLKDKIHLFRNELHGYEYGAMGVKFYQSVGVPLEHPQVIHKLDLDIENQCVGVIDDLIDTGGTLAFVENELKGPEYNASRVVLIAPFIKKRREEITQDIIYFGEVPSDTWIITPRERDETLKDRLLEWHIKSGIPLEECKNTFIRIGYDPLLLEWWFPVICTELGLIKD